MPKIKSGMRIVERIKFLFLYPIWDDFEYLLTRMLVLCSTHDEKAAINCRWFGFDRFGAA